MRDIANSRRTVPAPIPPTTSIETDPPVRPAANLTAPAPLPPGHEFGTMTTAEVAQLVEWAAAESWNPGRHDVAVRLATETDWTRGVIHTDAEGLITVGAARWGLPTPAEPIPDSGVMPHGVPNVV